MLFSGYHPRDRHPAPFTTDGFFDTGDYGALDADGRLHVHGRRSDLIITGGENVYPAEVEGVVLATDGVRDACVFGVADPEWGARVALAVVAHDDALDLNALAAALRTRLARFKCPTLITQVEEIPQLGIGKPDRRRAALEFSAQLQRVAGTT
jgi:acyl-CoA synthetase (AMP-forming)/AMP-acid ligase II